MSSKGSKKSKARRRKERALRAEVRRVRDKMEASGTPAPQKEGEPGDKRMAYQKLVLEGAAIRRPHLFGFNQAKREALGIKALTTAISPDYGPKISMIAMRNCLVMEAQEQALLAREAEEARKAAENPPAAAPVNVYVQQNNTQVSDDDKRRIIEEAAETAAILDELGALATRPAPETDNAEGNGVHSGQATS